MKNTIHHARRNPNLDLSDLHQLTTDQQNLKELTCAATVMVSQLDAVAIPEEMQEARARLRTAIRPVDINPKARKKNA